MINFLSLDMKSFLEFTNRENTVDNDKDGFDDFNLLDNFEDRVKEEIYNKHTFASDFLSGSDSGRIIRINRVNRSEPMPKNPI